MAEEEGFEPPCPCGPSAFKAAPIGLSGTPPDMRARQYSAGNRGDQGGGAPAVRRAVAIAPADVAPAYPSRTTLNPGTFSTIPARSTGGHPRPFASAIRRALRATSASP